MITVVDIDVLFFDASAEVEMWAQEFEAQWNQPLLMAAMAQELLTMPPEVQDSYREMDPRQFEQINKQIRRLKGRSYNANQR